MPKAPRRSPRSRRITRADAAAIVDSVKDAQNTVLQLEKDLVLKQQDASDDIRAFSTISITLTAISHHAARVSLLAQEAKDMVSKLKYGEFVEDWLRNHLLDATDVGSWYKSLPAQVANKLQEAHEEDFATQRAQIASAQKTLARAQHRAYRADL